MTKKCAWREAFYQPQLSPGAIILVVGCNEPKDVVMPKHAGLVDLHLPHPGLLIQAGEYLDRHIATPPLTTSHLSKPASPNNLL